MSRTVKQILYGSFFLIIWGAVLTGGYLIFFRSAPSCFDNVKNGREEGIDCGGGCIPCELKNLKIIYEEPKVFPASNLTTFIVKVSNPSLNYGTRKFDYTLQVIGKLGAPLLSLNRGASLRPNETKYLVMAGVEVNPKEVSIAKFNVLNYNWEESKNLPIYDFKFDKLSTDILASGPVVSGELTNNSSFNFSRVKISAILKDKGDVLLNGSETELNNVSAFSVRVFKIFFPKFDSALELDRTKTEVYAEPIND